MQHAVCVLLDPFLLQHIVSFQQGLPRDLLDLSQNNPRFNFAQCAIVDAQLDVLERVRRLRREQPGDIRFSFDFAWDTALRAGNAAALKWLYHNVDEVRENAFSVGNLQLALYGAMWYGLCGGSVEVVAWLFAQCPELKSRVTDNDIRCVAIRGNLQLFQWLEEQVPGLPVTATVMIAAATLGHFAFVDYLYTSRPDCFSEEVLAGAVSSENLELVRFLLVHCSAAITTFTKSLLQVSTTDMAQLLLEFCPQLLTGETMRWAAKYGEVQVMQALHAGGVPCVFNDIFNEGIHDARHEVIKFVLSVDAPHWDQQTFKETVLGCSNRKLLAVLHNKFHHLCDDKTLAFAAIRNRVDAVRYFVEHCDKTRVLPYVTAACRGEGELQRYLMACGAPDPQYRPDYYHTLRCVVKYFAGPMPFFWKCPRTECPSCEG